MLASPEREPSRSCSMSASAANLLDSSVISDAARLSISTAAGTSAARVALSTAGSASERGTAGHGTPAARPISSSRAAISASSAGKLGDGPADGIERARSQPVFR